MIARLTGILIEKNPPQITLDVHGVGYEISVPATKTFVNQVLAFLFLARRMGGGDKVRITIGGVSILDRVLATLSGQCVRLIINANGDPERFADTGCTVVPDSVPVVPELTPIVRLPVSTISTPTPGLPMLSSVTLKEPLVTSPPAMVTMFMFPA